MPWSGMRDVPWCPGVMAGDTLCACEVGGECMVSEANRLLLYKGG